MQRLNLFLLILPFIGMCCLMLEAIFFPKKEINKTTILMVCIGFLYISGVVYTDIGICFITLFWSFLSVIWGLLYLHLIDNNTKQKFF